MKGSSKSIATNDPKASITAVKKSSMISPPFIQDRNDQRQKYKRHYGNYDERRKEVENRRYGYQRLRDHGDQKDEVPEKGDHIINNCFYKSCNGLEKLYHLKNLHKPISMPMKTKVTPIVYITLNSPMAAMTWIIRLERAAMAA